jgi:energy-coupling factor transporter ATP-binding protein EcfA2
MSLHAPITSLTTTNGQTIHLNDDDVVVFIGPNNAGKSRMLFDLAGLYNGEREERVVAQEIKIDRRGTSDDLFAWLDSHCYRGSQGGETNYWRAGQDVNSKQALRFWEHEPGTLVDLGKLLSYFASADKRLQLTNPTNSIDPVSEAPSDPVHYLFLDDALEQRISEYCFAAFQAELILDRGGGRRINVYVGDRPRLAPGENATSTSYLQRLRQLPLLSAQGDGMRSYVGCLLASIATQTLVTFIDEPDVFLHPPQARELGRQLAQSKPDQKQLFLSTHNGNFLRGLLDSGSNNLKIIRLTRSGTTNLLHELPPEELHRVWKDPALRHTNMLDGLFYHRVVLCEGDSDCRFFQAMLHERRRREQQTGPEILFVPCGGKGRMAQVAASLRVLGTDVSAICDFDLLSDENDVERLVHALGGDSASIKSEARFVREKVEQSHMPRTKDEVLTLIQGVLGEADDTSTITRNELRDVDRIVRDSKVWASARAQGDRVVPAGDPTARLEQLDQDLRRAGLHLVRAGELESFCRQAGGKSAKWLDHVLSDERCLEEAYNAALPLIERIG